MVFEKCFKDKTILVTGAGRGIGRAISKQLHDYGAKVYALSKTLENLSTLTEECPNIIPICVDLSDWVATKKALLEIEVLDCLVNNAGIQGVKPFMEIESDIFDSHMNVNVKAVINVSQEVARKMMEAGRPGSILNVSSMAATKCFAGNATYAVSKAGLEILTKCMALELGPHKIRVNSIRPGMVDTDMLRNGFASVKNPAQVMEQMKQLTASIPLRQLLMPMDEVVNTALFLVSDLATNITGQSLAIDAGFLCS